MTFGENNSLPTPAQHLGFEVGADRRLADWGQIVEYLERLDRASERVKTLEIGQKHGGQSVSADNHIIGAQHRKLGQAQADTATVGGSARYRG